MTCHHLATAWLLQVSSLTGSRVGRVRRKVAPEEGREPDPNPRQVLVAMRERVRRVDGMLPFSGEGLADGARWA